MMTVRLVIASVLCGLVGLEREVKGHPAVKGLTTAASIRNICIKYIQLKKPVVFNRASLQRQAALVIS